MNLIIVESPTKARTLSRFLGKEFDVLATMGHVKDLPKSKLGVVVEKKFKSDYLLVKGKEESVKDIEVAAKKAKEIFLATDPDREGEAIAKHIEEILGDTKTTRIVFHEITKGAVKKAINTPRKIDRNLVNAQIARRVLDRLVGYKLSPLLWKKVRRGLSAGRVQTVTVRLIVEKEREIEAFKKDEYWEIYCELSKNEKVKFEARLTKILGKKAEVGGKKEAKGIVSDLNKAKYSVSEVRKREVVKGPYPPFTTSTMTQAASRLFRWTARRTMGVAQRLYEEGLITYHRTDSTIVSKVAISKVRPFIEKEYGNNYLAKDVRVFKTKSKVAQEAHEAIRPTKVNVKSLKTKKKVTRDSQKLYNLIWRRFVSGQMAESVYNETSIDILAKGKKEYLLRVSGQVMRFDGWRKVFGGKLSGDVNLPDLNEKEVLSLIKVRSEQKFTKPPARFTEASLIKTLESLGIGRPSTYAPTITTVLHRQYVEKIERKFHPTPVGVAVNDFLLTNFPETFDYSFTAGMEDELDDVANGEIKKEKVLDKFWKPFEKKLKKTEDAKRIKIETEKLGKKCPDCKKGELVIRIGRFGKFVSCSAFPDCKHTEKYIQKIGMKCLDCKKGDIIIKRTGKGRQFFGCSRYPDCEWASWKKPGKETTIGS